MTEEDILALIQQDDWMMGVLRTASSINLPDWMIGAGFVRNKVWNQLHGMEQEHTTDVDVAYFDKENTRKTTEEAHEAVLKSKLAMDWDVKNQARMHLLHDEKPYRSTEDAIAHWPETATCVAVRLDQRGEIELIAPYGVEDLVNLTIRTSPLHGRPNEVAERIAKKGWLERWPKLRVA